MSLTLLILSMNAVSFPWTYILPEHKARPLENAKMISHLFFVDDIKTCRQVV